MAMSKNIIECSKLTHGFAGRSVLSDVSLTVGASERIALVGPSGCGKSTLLNLISGLIEPNSGELRNSVHADDISFVFQEPSLLPWKTVSANVTLFGDLLNASSKAMDSGQTAETGPEGLRLKMLLEQVSLWEWRNSYPDELSGGMKMRAALARALYKSPKLLLLDEPFAALDDITRETLQDELINLSRSSQMAVVLVTHNIEEAVLLSDRIIVFSSAGRIQLEINVNDYFEANSQRRNSPKILKLKALIHAQWKENDGRAT
ncbi:MAG: hypothetical protein RJB13_308 [Pseudomonadota bacterium]|jgi:NitT/TauT family transport system ATP-binding protein